MSHMLRGASVALAASALLTVAGCGAGGATPTVRDASDTTIATASASPPILAGPWAPDQEGYGRVEPSTVFNGGDPTGQIKRIEWLTWGGPRAVGVGSGFYVAPAQITAEGHRAAAVIVAFHLGRCHGRSAYDAVQWYFPEYGEHFNPHSTGYKICS